MRSNFGNDVKDFTLQFDKATEETMREVTEVTFSEIVRSTPVDEGRLRGNWQISDHVLPSRILTQEDKSGSNAINKIKKFTKNSKNFSIFTLTNKLPYANVVEFGGYPDPVKQGTKLADGSFEKRSKSGYSKLAPNGMVRINMNKTRRLLEVIAKKRLPK